MSRRASKSDAAPSAAPSAPGCDGSKAGSGLQHLSDHELLEGIRASSEPHFSELYERYFPRIYRYVQRRMRNESEAEEIVQEVFVAVFRSLDGYRGESSLLAWIYGIAKNTLNASWRRAAKRRARLEAVDRTQLEPSRCLIDCTPEEHLVMRQYVREIGDQLGALAEWQIEVFTMRHLENLSIGEISARTQRTSESVRSSLYRMKRLIVQAAQAEVG